MEQSRVRTQIVTLLIVVVGLGLLFYSIGFAGKSEAQGAEKSLDIERHGNEPLKLVDLRISGKSLKDDVKVKLRRGDDGFDSVHFRDADDWARRVTVRLRNVSGKMIIGFQAYLYLKPAGSDVLFSVTLTGSKHLEETALPPGEEVEAKVDDESWERAVIRLMGYGGEVRSAGVSLSVGIVGFTDGLQWHKGHTLRVDPDNPKRHIPVETKKPPGLSKLDHFRQPNFEAIAFMSNETRLDWSWSESMPSTFSPRPIQINAQRCVVNNGSYDAPHCNDDPNASSCYTIRGLGAYENGTSSSVPVNGDCRQLPGQSGVTCTQQTTHYDLQTDPSCASPSPTPTLTCLPDGYVYHGDVPCCSGAHPDVGDICGPAASTPNPTPTPQPTCYPNGSTCFTQGACCSGYCDGSYRCAANASATPTPMSCLPNGYLYFGGTPCCSGYSTPDGVCASRPTCQPDGWWCNDDPQCCSGNCDYLFIECYSYSGGGGGGGGDECNYECYWDEDCICDYCDGYWCQPIDPVLVDLSGHGFDMTDAANGVTFDFFGHGTPRRLSWTATGSDDAWLVLDRNRNGNIDNGKEMFSNMSPQPQPRAGSSRIGFLALAEYDKAAHGGNGDGVIDKNDEIFPYLRLWQDANHNGTSESSESHRSRSLGL